jgi:hypothetical protein
MKYYITYPPNSLILSWSATGINEDQFQWVQRSILNKVCGPDGDDFDILLYPDFD